MVRRPALSPTGVPEEGEPGPLAGQWHDETAVEETIGPLAGGLRGHDAAVAGGAVQEVLGVLGHPPGAHRVGTSSA